MCTDSLPDEINLCSSGHYRPSEYADIFTFLSLYGEFAFDRFSIKHMGVTLEYDFYVLCIMHSLEKKQAKRKAINVYF